MINKRNVGLPKEFFDREIPSFVENSIEEAISVYKDLGAEIVEVSLKNINLLPSITLLHLQNVLQIFHVTMV